MDPDGQAHVFDCMPTKYKLSSASDRIFWINAKVSGSHIVFSQRVPCSSPGLARPSVSTSICLPRTAT